MNAKHIESKFSAMGARLKVREIPSRWRMGDRRWIDPADFAVDIQHDGSGEFFTTGSCRARDGCADALQSPL